MTREEMIALANQAGMSNLSLIDIGYLEAFVNLILESAAKEFDLIPYGKVDRQTAIFAIRSMKV